MALICIIKIREGMEMKNLREKVLNVFNGNEKIDGVMDDLSNYQKKLAKNITNPLFSNNAKNQMLKTCAELHNLEKTLYRYKTAKQLNKLSVAQEEQNNAEDIILKGSVSNVRYVWRSELSEKTCDVCSDLDGQEFDLYDDIPPMPHPNCKCFIDVIAAIPPENKPTNNTKPNWIMPCNGKILSPYGWRIHPISKTRKFHKGIDIEAKIGTPVKAIASGVVVYAGNNDPRGYGNYVVINHGTINGKVVTSEYGHLSSWNVKAGQRVTQGQVVAKSGNTGGSSGPHVHVTIKENGIPVPPSKYIMY